MGNRKRRSQRTTKHTKSNDPAARGYKAPDRQRELADEFEEWRLFATRIRKYLHRRRELHVYAVTLTYPRDSLRKDWLFKSIHWLIGKLEGDEFLWVLLHRGKKGAEKHLHWHGIVALSRTKEWLSRSWRDQTGASKKAMRVGFLRGQDGDRSGRYFRKNVRDWVRYCCNREPDLDLTLRERVVVSGSMEKEWVRVFGRGSNGPYVDVEEREGVVRLASPALASAIPATPAVRLCRGCDEPLPPEYPSNKWYHDARPGRPDCKPLARSRRRKARRSP